MENIEYSKSLYQINEILKYITPNLKNRIPEVVLRYFENNKLKDYNWKIDKTKSLEKQDLLPITKEILTVLYREYMCDEEERTKLNKILCENEIKYQNELRKKYNSYELFKNRQNNIQIENKSTSIGNYKGTFFSKIISKIKLFFGKQ